MSDPEIYVWGTYYGAEIIFNERHNATFLGGVRFAPLEEPDGLITEGDRRVLEAARISFNSFTTGLSGDTARDKKLIKYLMDNKHSSPFQHVMYTFTLCIPVFVKSQAERHRTFDFTYWQINEESRRYSSNDVQLARHDIPWRLQSKSAKQGSAGLVDDRLQEDIERTVGEHYERMFQIYNWMIAKGVALEQARQIIPQSMLCTMLCTVDLWNLIQFLIQRCDPHAQREIRVLAYIIKNKMIPRLNPWISELITEEFDRRGWVQAYE